MLHAIWYKPIVYMYSHACRHQEHEQHSLYTVLQQGLRGSHPIGDGRHERYEQHVEPHHSRTTVEDGGAVGYRLLAAQHFWAVQYSSIAATSILL